MHYEKKEKIIGWLIYSSVDHQNIYIYPHIYIWHRIACCWNRVWVNLQFHCYRIWIDQAIFDWNAMRKGDGNMGVGNLQIEMIIRNFFVRIWREEADTKWITSHCWRWWSPKRRPIVFTCQSSEADSSTYNRDFSWMEWIRNSSTKEEQDHP